MLRHSLIIAIVGIVLLAGCASQPSDPRVNMGKGVGSDTAQNNIITGPFGHIVSALLGEGVVITDVIEAHTPEGFLDVQMRGYNKAYGIKRFEYRVEWLDANGMTIPTKTSVWTPCSAMGKSEVSFRFIAPRREAVNFRLNTRKDKKS